MAHLMTILFFLAAGGVAFGIIMGMLAQYAGRMARILGQRHDEDAAGPVPAVPLAVMRPAPAFREARLRAAA